MTEITTILSISEKGVYSYKPSSVTVTKSNTTLIYALDDSTAQIWEIVGMTNTDSKNQLSNQTKAASGNSISVLDINSLADTFDVTVVAQHRSQRERLLRVDPGVQNIPT